MGSLSPQHCPACSALGTQGCWDLTGSSSTHFSMGYAPWRLMQLSLANSKLMLFPLPHTSMRRLLK